MPTDGDSGLPIWLYVSVTGVVVYVMLCSLTSRAIFGAV
jgi:hypothetical protein